MSQPLVRPYITYEELSRLPGDGHRYELFDGEAYVSPSPSLWHQDVLISLFLAFHPAAQGVGRVYIAPMDVVLAPATAPQPDLVVVLDENASILKDVIRGVPDLVLEVLSPSTAAMDRGLKMETYARHGVPEYWLVDRERQAIEIYRLDRAAGAYRLAQTCRRGDQATTPLLPVLSVEVDRIFG
ncbi:MAG TPA: Uma2 family endonuclease [Thermoanaerobaculia bacterium]|nr:Uma2 family endonuclease [Thermoanaerobaculia bacterium]